MIVRDDPLPLWLVVECLGYRTAMSDASPLPASDEADSDKQSTPGGMVRDLEEKAAEEGATTGDDRAGEPLD